MAIIEDLIVSEYGAFVGVHHGRLQVEAKDTKRVEAPLLHLRSVQVLTRSASISAAALAACCEAGIAVHFVDAINGNYASVLSSKLTTVVTTRRCQLQIVESPQGVEIARSLAVGKIRSQAVNLRYLARRQEAELARQMKEVELELLAYSDQLERTEAQTVADVRNAMMDMEGYCARIYWGVLGQFIPSDYGWSGRAGRHATDPVNCLLNYGYGILFERDCRKNFAEHILSRLKAQGTYQRKRYELRSIIQMQARRLASAFRGESDYQAYTGG